MKKKVLFAVFLVWAAMSLSVHADFSAVWNDGGELEINTGENETGVVVTNRLNEILYINQGSGIFKTNIKNRSEIKINVGDAVSGNISGKILDKQTNFIYVSPTGDDQGGGTQFSPFLTLSAALQKAKDGDTVTIMGEISAQNIVCTKDVAISGGTLDISGNTAFSVSGKVTLGNICIKNGTGEKIVLADGAKIGKNVKFANDAVAECAGNVRIESGNFTDITVNDAVLHILGDAEVNSAVYTEDSSAVIFENCDLSGKIAQKKGKIFVLDGNGTAEMEKGKLRVLPEDGRVYSVNGADYQKEPYFVCENGLYNIKFEYNAKLCSFGISQSSGGYKVTVAAVNNNLNNDAATVQLMAAVYDKKGVLKKILRKESNEKNITMEETSAEITAEDTVKIFCWDSFEKIVPLAAACAGKTRELVNEKKEFFVSPEGDDENPGTVTHPFKTLKKAQSAARRAGAGTTVYFREGEYYFSTKCNFTSSDNGITYKAYDGEKAVFTTVKPILGSMFEEIPQEIKDKIKDDGAKRRVLRVKLDEHGFGQIPEPEDRTYANKAINPILFSDGKRMSLARYPDSGYINITSVTDSGVDKDKDGNVTQRRAFAFSAGGLSGKRDEWKNEDGFYIFGYFGAEWTDAFYKCSFSGDSSISALNKNTGYPVTKGDRFYCANILEELNAEGEWYFDRENNYIYIYPFADFNENSKIKYTVRNVSLDSFISIKGADNVVFDGIVFEGISANEYAIKISDYCENVIVRNCEFTNLVCKAVGINKSENCIIEGNYAHDTSRGVFVADGGDSETLSAGANIISNNKIERFAQEKTTYEPAIALYGVGNTASHNEISDSAHMAIGFYGQKCIMEYNEIYDVCNDTLDSGAIYAGLTFTAPGNVMRFNYIHDIKNNVKELTGTATTVVGIYFDERLSGEYVYSNVFKNIDRAVFIGSGRCNAAEGNVMIDCKQSVYIARYWSFTESLLDGLKVYENNTVWQREFPWLKTTAEDEPMDPKYNRVNNNALYNSAQPQIPESYRYLLDPTGNVVFESPDIFADFENGNYSVSAGSEIYSQIPGFGMIPFDEIGLLNKKGETR